MHLSGLRGIRTIRDLDLKDKNLFLRLDLNVPLEKGKITDDTRIRASLPTLQYALEKGARVVLASHLGRPKSEKDTQYSLEPVATHLSQLAKVEVLLMEDFEPDGIRGALHQIKRNQVVMLENLRFVAGETKNNLEFAQVLAAFTEVYVNDAFGASHRAHSSIVALPELVSEKGIGFLVEKEVKMLDHLLENPQKPYLAVLGGSKVSDKIAVIEKLIDLVDGFVIGGAMAYTFLKAQGAPVGRSLVETDRISYAKEMIGRMEARGKTLLLPVDHVVTSSITDVSSAKVVKHIPDDQMGVDIGPESIRIFSTALAGAKTIFWNGPMGVFETEAFSKGTFAVAKALAENPNMKIVGGGDSAAAAEMSGYAPKMTHISTGGGASLEYLQGERLPGLEVLRVKRSENIQ